MTIIIIRGRLIMEFKPAKCPSCGGNLQVPPDMKTAKCMYCGGDFIIEDAIKLAMGQVNIDNLFELADAAKNIGNYIEAYNYYTRILEADSNNYKAWYGKALSAGWQSSTGNPRLQEVRQPGFRSKPIANVNGIKCISK
jgi:tetratricopeptide (TPR) repeat protein